MRVSPAVVAPFCGLALLLSAGEIKAGSPGDTATCEGYDPESGSWNPTGDLVVRRSEHTAILLSDGSVLAVGGAERGAVGPADRTEQYDPAIGEWAEVGRLHVGRMWHTATLLSDGNVLVAGGI